MVDIAGGVYGLGPEAPPGPLKRVLRKAVHFLSYNFILKRNVTRATRAAGFRLTVRPTVFHPKLFVTSELFAGFIGRLDLKGRRVADVGTGSGILALAAARAGAACVTAIDINPNAARAAAENARANGFGGQVTALCSNLMAALAPGPLFDVILSNPPYFPGAPRDLADRAWHAGPAYCDIILLFRHAAERLAPAGRMYVLLSSSADLALLGTLIAAAGFQARLVARHSILIEAFVIYELWAE